MAEAYAQQDHLSRLDMIEAALEHAVGEHEMFRVEHKGLLRSQVLFQDSPERLKESLHQRFKHLEGTQ